MFRELVEGKVGDSPFGSANGAFLTIARRSDIHEGDVKDTGESRRSLRWQPFGTIAHQGEINWRALHPALS